jgi:hypothetical protein
MLATVRLRLFLTTNIFGAKNLYGYDRIAQYYFRPGDYDSEVDEAVDGAKDSDESSNNE